MTAVQNLDALVIGAGQAGLAAAWHLQRAGLNFLVLEASDAVGGAWNLYYDSLTLFSPRRFSELPGMAFPKAAGECPRKNEVSAYLAAYADRFGFPIRTRCNIVSVRHDGQLFTALNDGGNVFEAANVIVAAGGFATPNWPKIPGENTFKGTTLHAYAYRNPTGYEGKRIVVVGGGNSAVQIAAELADCADVTLATRQPIKYLPARVLGVDLHYWLWLTRFDRTRLFNGEGTPVLDNGTYKAIIAAGRPRHRAMFSRYTENGVAWPDGEENEIDAVIYATGYRPTASFLAELLGALDVDGRPRQHNGVADLVPGLFFVGIPNQRNLASATLRGVGPDAAYIVRAMKRR
ncbi:flavin-containing monooxygenase [Rhizobium anhuiense]|uniref:FAD-binding protein n=1 Tax=Rhizobium anhuiense TaxID=1184720 RepID=A0A432P0F7_9HYPH|nr:FAD-dependent oxidoreductase [Rhizobium anhuiense]RUM05043.1 FAD-binding protein [Rhizobium anhuiense]GGD66765.1 monooxygenase [Rhizobium anhuiense]